MAVPEDIRKVPRPKNTVVECTGKQGKNMYPVRERSNTKYIKNGNPQPHNGKVVGHIIDYTFVPVADKVVKNAEMLSYGTAALIKSVSEDILSDLLSVYPVNIAYSIFVLASLKVEKPGIKFSRCKSRYESSYLSLFYPGAALSGGTISKLLKEIGMDESKRRTFFRKRMKKISEKQHILIDGTLKENNSIINDLAHYSYKSKVKGTEDISLIYAYDFESKEPLCCEVFPGNHLDSVAYSNFLQHNAITKGIIIDDKGFPVNKITEVLKNNPELHYLTPIKRTDSRIDSNDMMTFDEVIDGIDENILARKKKLRGGNYLYAFKDSYKAGKEMQTAVNRAKTNGSFDQKEYIRKEKKFGTIVFESDLDMTCKEAYLSYTSRWELELLFKAYKSELSLKTTRVQNDFSVFGSEFVNFISTLITRRIINKFISLGLLEDDTYGDIIDDLNAAWRMSAPIDNVPDSKDKNWVHVNIGTLNVMKKLGIAK